MSTKLMSNGLEVLKRRYLAKDEKGNVIETPEELFHRVAKTVAAVETDPTERQLYEDKFYEMMSDLDFLPNSPTLMNAGRPLGQLSACFVLPVKDSMHDIFMTIHDTAIIHKTGGGTGFSFSKLRPKGARVASSDGQASGPISFMHAFDAATGTVAQGGKRRGANMGLLRVDHPDIMEFIKVKNDLKTLNNFNISVGITAAFMDALKDKTQYALIDPQTGDVDSYMDAELIWNMIVESAWKTGEPGIVFLDRINETNFLEPLYGKIEATNPCGEQPLLPYEACNLGSINLANFVNEDTSSIDYDRLGKIVQLAVRFLDDVIDANHYPMKQIAEMCKATRKIGLGVMGFADMLQMLNVAYASEEGLNIGKSVMKFIQDIAHHASAALGQERGVYPAYNMLPSYERMLKLGYSSVPKRRNAMVTTIAPTGSISAIAGVSSGIEPLFSNVFYKHYMDDDYHPIINERLMAELERTWCGTALEEMKRIIMETGSVADLPDIPDHLRGVYACAHDITPDAHVMMQAAFQANVDNAISKTVNLQEHASQEDVAKIYKMAYQMGCKGVTVYRDKCRDSQVLNTGTIDKKRETTSQDSVQAAFSRYYTTEDFKHLVENVVKQFYPKLLPGLWGYTVAVPEATSIKKRPEILSGLTKCVPINCGKLYVTVNHDEKNNLFEVFTTNGKGGGCPAQSEAVCRLASLLLRAGVDPLEITRQLRGIKCTACLKNPKIDVLSCPDAIGRMIEKEYQKLESIGVPESINASTIEEPHKRAYPDTAVITSTQMIRCGGEMEHIETTINGVPVCPQCGMPLQHEGGCTNCPKCGYSNCG